MQRCQFNSYGPVFPMHRAGKVRAAGSAAACVRSRRDIGIHLSGRTGWFVEIGPLSIASG
jgi:hypothetical protein